MELKLYTKTVCPKCILVKSVLVAAGIEYEEINIDTNDEVRQFLIDKGIMAAPVLFYNDKYLTSVPEINKVISEVAE